MKTFFKFGVCMVIMAITFMGCDELFDLTTTDSKDVKLSPPSWIQGSWASEGSTTEILKVTSNDVIYAGESLKEQNSSAFGIGYKLKETKNTGSLYEITITASTIGAKESAIYSFKKDSGSRILHAINKSGGTVNDSDYIPLIKLK